MIKTQLHWRHVPYSIIFYLSLNALQIIAALVVIGIFASDISDGSTDVGRSVFSIVAASLSVIVAIALAIETFHAVPSRVWLVFVFLWQWSLVSLWAVATGLVGAIHFHGGPSKMEAGAAFNLLNLTLWVFGTFLGSLACCQRGKRLDPPGETKDVDPDMESKLQTSVKPKV